jgi:hypothetical protein
MIEAGIDALLRATPSVALLIPGGIFAVLVPPDAVYPCISFHTMSKPPMVNLDKSAEEATRVQIDCWAKDYISAKNIQATLHALLDGYQGTLPNGTIVNLCARDVESDYFESDDEMFRAMSEYVITFPAGQ